MAKLALSDVAEALAGTAGAVQVAEAAEAPADVAAVSKMTCRIANAG